MNPPTNGSPYVWVLDELADFLAAELRMTIATDIFVNELPAPGVNGEPIRDGLYIVGMPSPAPDGYIDTETYIVDVWTSSSDTSTAQQLLRTVYAILHRKANYALVNWYIYSSLANGIIKPEGRGQEGNALFSLSLTIVCRNLNNIS